MNLKVGDRVKIKKNDICGEDAYSNMTGHIIYIGGGLRIRIELSNESKRKIARINEETNQDWRTDPLITIYSIIKLNSMNGVVE